MKNPTPEIRRSEGVRALEALCAELFASVQGPAACVVQSRAEAPHGGHDAIGVSLRAGGELEVAFATPQSRLQRSETIVAMARNIAQAAHRCDARWVMLSKPQSSAAAVQYQLRLVNARGPDSQANATQSATVRAGAGVMLRLDPQLLEQLTPPVSRGVVSLRSIMATLKLALCAKQVEPPATVTGEIAIAATQWCLAVIDPQGRVWRAEFVNQERKGVRMSEEKLVSTEFPVQVELGTLSLSSEVLLDLRPGDEIAVAEAIPMVGTMRIGAQPWARVRIEQREGDLVLKVEELLGIEETFPEKSRLAS